MIRKPTWVLCISLDGQDSMMGTTQHIACLEPNERKQQCTCLLLALSVFLLLLSQATYKYTDFAEHFDKCDFSRLTCDEQHVCFLLSLTQSRPRLFQPTSPPCILP